MHRHDPLGVLEEEHRTIEVLLDGLETACSTFPPWAILDELLSLLTSFADRDHHAKEELILFPALTDSGLSFDNGPVACMQREHDHCRALMGEMREHLILHHEHRFALAATAYVRFLREHIAKEDMILFPLARRVLGHRALARIEAAFPGGPAEEIRLREANERANQLLLLAQHEAQAS